MEVARSEVKRTKKENIAAVKGPESYYVKIKPKFLLKKNILRKLKGEPETSKSQIEDTMKWKKNIKMRPQVKKLDMEIQQVVWIVALIMKK